MDLQLSKSFITGRFSKEGKWVVCVAKWVVAWDAMETIFLRVEE